MGGSAPQLGKGEAAPCRGSAVDVQVGVATSPSQEMLPLTPSTGPSLSISLLQVLTLSSPEPPFPLVPGVC